MPRPGLSALAVALAALPAAAQTISRTDLKPGLVFTVTDVGQAPALARIEPTVALNLAPGEAAHPRSAGGSEFRWRGHLNVLRPGKYRFDATLLGSIEVAVGGKTVLQATVRGNKAETREGDEVELAAGIQPFEATLRRTGSAVRAELIWRGPGFRPEPVPYQFLGHLPAQRPGSFAADLRAEHGRFLFEELSCARCHKPADDDRMARTLADRAGPDLSEIGRRTYPGWLDAWLADPAKLRPHTAMPGMFADDERGKAERYAVVAYLASLGGPMPSSEPPRRRGQPNQADLQRSIANGQRLYVTTGCAACHGEQLTQPPVRRPRDDFDEEDERPPLKPEDSFHALGTAGPAGLYQLGSLGSKTTPEVLARYLQNPLATNPHGRMPNMLLSGQEAQDIARYLCRQTDETIRRTMPAEPGLSPAEVAAPGGTVAERWRFARTRRADQWKEAGKRVFAAKGCASCHTTGEKGETAVTPSLSALRESGGRGGCLAEKPDAGKVPVYRLDADQRAALAAFLKDGLSGPGSPAPAYHARVAFKRFNCLACHSRDGEGGFSPDLSERVRLMERAENADDITPPLLTGVGHKLRTPWLKQVLTGAGRARPWMTLRMPQYGEAHVGFLVDAVPKLEGTAAADDTPAKVSLSAAKVEAGRKLAGKDGGLGCVSCHDISGIQTGGTRGPDLATTQQRVRHDWYVRWMHQPQRLAPGTRMPQNFEDGRSQLADILGGDADAQIEALWAYLSLGPGLPLPAGIEPPGRALVVAVKDRPEVLRTFLPDAGTKAIAVGYPGGVSLAFDAATCRLAYAWTGNFLDAAPVWTNRGGNPARLLGPKFWTAPPGFPWAATESRTPPDLLKRAEDPAYGYQLPDDRYYGGPRYVRFDGYALDPAGTPAFRYALTDGKGTTRLAVVEKPEPLPVSVAAGVRRTFTLDRPAGETTWFLAGVATKEPRVYTTGGKAVPLKPGETPAAGTRLVIPADGDRAAVVDLLAAPAGSAWHVERQPRGGWVVLLRLPESDEAGKAEVSLAVWGLPRDDEELIRGLK
jgi:mono/diheme cytochrome c family protein